ncbi:MAG: YkgJ family cysteine cluster protein [Deltaproteobacteria bacterium]|nr:YkgJ family cysteine cluster protein [Deltaproteobacteria bacterium]
MSDLLDQKEFKFSPCIDKNCSFCCDPVKLFRFSPDDKIPTNKNGDKIWKERDEIYIPKDFIDKVKLNTYDCIYFDKINKKCLQYEKRPLICRKVSCVDENSLETIDEQYRKIISSIFIVIKPMRKSHE